MLSFKLPKFQTFSKQQKKIAALIACFIFTDLLLGIFLIATRHKSGVKLECFGSDVKDSLFSLDKSARSGFIKSGDYANFKFTESQRERMAFFYEENGTLAITIRFQVNRSHLQKRILSGDENLYFRYGFLSDQDFNSKGKFIRHVYQPSHRILVQGDLKMSPEVFDVSFAVQKNDDIRKVLPEGFFIYSSVKCKVVAACIMPAKLGFDIASSISFYGFAYNGGIIDFENKSFDFSGGSMIFPVVNNTKMTMPEFAIKLSDNPENKSSKEKSVRAEINLGGEKLFINNVVPADEIIVPCDSMKAPFSRLEIVNNAECVSSVMMNSTNRSGSEVLIPIRTEPGLILNYKRSGWRTLDYEIFEWDRFSNILFFDTRNYNVQNNFFRRMAYFVEKQGYKGRLLTNEELADLHGYNAHDYSAVSMADFFNKASKTGFVLNKEELLLKKILIANGLLESDGDFVRANEGGIVSISQETPEWNRQKLLAHEGWHTIFFRDADFRNFVSAVFYTFDPRSRAFLIDYFKSQPQLGYDINDDYLLQNEFMAYIMQQKLSDVASYFVHCANRGSVMKYTPELAAYVRETKGRGFEDAAVALNDYVYDKYGIVCGNISLVSKY